jgi:hypothetical protein
MDASEPQDPHTVIAVAIDLLTQIGAPATSSLALLRTQCWDAENIAAAFAIDNARDDITRALHALHKAQRLIRRPGHG